MSLDIIRQQNPLIHNITNIVAAHYVANGLLAIGASPIMSDAIEEMEELPSICNGLVINIGTLTTKQVNAMLIAGKTANHHGIPVILDPVGVGSTHFRQKSVDLLLSEIQFSAIRGNAGEMAYLAKIPWQSKGVDAGQGSADLVQIAKIIAQQYQCSAIISGAIDVLSDGTQIAKIYNGTPLFSKITASGCLLSAICGAFLGVSHQVNVMNSTIFNSSVEACLTYAIAGELAAQGLNATKNGQFYTALLDQLASLTSEQIQQLARINYE